MTERNKNASRRPKLHKPAKVVRDQPNPVGAPSKEELNRLIAEHASSEAKMLEAGIVAFLRQGVPFEAIEIVHETATGEVETAEGFRLKLVSRAYVRVKPGTRLECAPAAKLCPVCNEMHREQDPHSSSQMDDFLNRHRDD